MFAVREDAQGRWWSGRGVAGALAGEETDMQLEACVKMPFQRHKGSGGAVA